VEGFGFTEALSMTHCNPLHGPRRMDSIGLPLPDVECQIVDLTPDRRPVPVGEVGELIVTTPALARQGHALPLRDNWLYSGELVRMDEQGFFYLVETRSALVQLGGEWVYPSTVEQILGQHAGVREVAVAGVPDPADEEREVLKAWVVPVRDWQPSTEELIKFCQMRLPPSHVPVRFTFVKELPKNPSGRIRRGALMRLERSRLTTIPERHPSRPR
jgi:long-chain acyl-CoA synthetase